MATPAGRAPGPVQYPFALPSDFTARVRLLSHNTLVHIPISCRLRLCQLTRQAWDGCADGDAQWAALEEGRSKLLLGPVPEGMALAEEVLARTDLWENGEFATLLSRIEQQNIQVHVASWLATHPQFP